MVIPRNVYVLNLHFHTVMWILSSNWLLPSAQNISVSVRGSQISTNNTTTLSQCFCCIKLMATHIPNGCMYVHMK